jgi:pyruvate/2-oxoglutarate dehydrogenase complex dihydrolipoamide acyltransferase (E2) component
VSFDHDVIDGAPVARFGRTLTELLEHADVLQNETAGQPTLAVQ